MSEKLDIALTLEGKTVVTSIVEQLGHPAEVKRILDEPFHAQMNTMQFMRKPSGRSDQGYRED